MSGRLCMGFRDFERLLDCLLAQTEGRIARYGYSNRSGALGNTT